MDGYGGAGGRHRRVDPQLAVHLVFDDLSEVVLGPDSALGRSLAHLATWLTDLSPRRG